MKLQLHISQVLFKILVTLAALSYTAASTKQYIDLLELKDNDEFVWGLHENEHANYMNTEKQQKNASSLLYEARPDRLKKRQTEQQQQQLKQNIDFGACKTAQGDEGRCRHLIYCRLPELKNDVWRLVSQLCIIEKNSIGICCPDHIASRTGPQIIENINENTLTFNGRIVNQPEQRGCGITTKQFPRITGGRPAEPEEWPWMAAIMRPGLTHVWCGGVLITDRHVLTAAHCVAGFEKQHMFVRLGEYDTQLLNETRARDFRIASVVTHVDYNPLTYEHDIAMLRVERATLFNTYIWPVCMPPLGEHWEERMAVVTGWGTQTFGGEYSNVLKEALVPIWKLVDCKKAVVERIPDTAICAGMPEGGHDSCQGDSGGPLLLQLPNRRWITIGIVSWGLGCGEANHPGVYTRVDKYLHWIVENVDT